MGVENGERRWTDKLLGFSVALVGALSAILWGIVWSSVSSAQARLGILEGDKRVIEERLKSMDGKLDRIEKALERRNP